MILAALIAALAAAQPPGPADEPLYVSRQGFDCLVRNIGTIARHRGDPLEIDIRSCPPRISGRLHSFPLLRQRRPSGGTEPILMLTRAEVLCIQANRRRLHRLRQRVDADRYRLSLAACER